MQFLCSILWIVTELMCFIKLNTADRRIAGGREVAGDRSFMVYFLKANLHKDNDKHLEWTCGGSIITMYHILTSAACLRTWDNLYVIAGYRRYVNAALIDQDECTKKRKKKVIKTCTPSSYIRNNYESSEVHMHNIGIATVESPFNFSDVSYLLDCSYVPSPIAVSFGRTPLEIGTDVVQLGWGHMEKLRLKSEIMDHNEEFLREASTLIVSGEECKTKYRHMITETDVRKFICTSGYGNIDSEGNVLDYSELIDGCDNENTDESEKDSKEDTTDTNDKDTNDKDTNDKDTNDKNTNDKDTNDKDTNDKDSNEKDTNDKDTNSTSKLRVTKVTDDEIKAVMDKIQTVTLDITNTPEMTVTTDTTATTDTLDTSSLLSPNILRILAPRSTKHSFGITQPHRFHVKSNKKSVTTRVKRKNKSKTNKSEKFLKSNFMTISISPNKLKLRTKSYRLPKSKSTKPGLRHSLKSNTRVASVSLKSSTKTPKHRNKYRTTKSKPHRNTRNKISQLNNTLTKPSNKLADYSSGYNDQGYYNYDGNYEQTAYGQSNRSDNNYYDYNPAYDYYYYYYEDFSEINNNLTENITQVSNINNVLEKQPNDSSNFPITHQYSDTRFKKTTYYKETANEYTENSNDFNNVSEQPYSVTTEKIGIDPTPVTKFENVASDNVEDTDDSEETTIIYSQLRTLIITANFTEISEPSGTIHVKNQTKDDSFETVTRAVSIHNVESNPIQNPWVPGENKSYKDYYYPYEDEGYYVEANKTAQDFYKDYLNYGDNLNQRNINIDYYYDFAQSDLRRNMPKNVARKVINSLSKKYSNSSKKFRRTACRRIMNNIVKRRKRKRNRRNFRRSEPSICQNDNGGPLVTWIGGIQVVIGISVSNLYDNWQNCVPPNVYTSTAYHPWFIRCSIETAPDTGSSVDEENKKQCLKNAPQDEDYKIDVKYMKWPSETKSPTKKGPEVVKVFAVPPPLDKRNRS